MEVGESSGCYTSGSVAGAVFGTLLTVLVLAGLAYLFWRYYWRRRRGKHLSLETGEVVEGAATTGPLGDRFAFDNPCFLSEDASPNRKNKKGTPKIKADGVQAKADKNAKSDKGGGTGRLGKWTSWSPIGALVGSGGTNSKQNEKRRAFDDSFIGEPERVSVSLRGHDFTGLGFNVCGNMRDGIFVRDVLHRGPASESGQISAGDRIVSLGISFEHMVFEDALTILSYASPYEVLLQVEKGASPPGSTLLAGTDISSGQTSLKRTAAANSPSGTGASHSPDKQRAIICHPFYRSQSIDDLDKIGKASINAKRAQQIAEMTRVKNIAQDDANQGNNKGATIMDVDGRSHQKEVEDEKLQRRENPAMEDDPKREGETGAHHTGYQKFGVRVLPMGNPSADKAQGMGKVHNPGHANNPTTGNRPEKTEEVSITVATPEPQKQNERNSMIEMGAGKDMKLVLQPQNPTENATNDNPPKDHTVIHMSEENNKEPGTKHKTNDDKEAPEPKNQMKEAKNPHDNMEDVKKEMDEIEKREELDRLSNDGMMVDVPEEVCMAGFAAVTNRKSAAASGQPAKMEEEDVKHARVTRQSSISSGDEGGEDGEKFHAGNTSGNGGKRRAPAPPPEPIEMNCEKTDPTSVPLNSMEVEESTPYNMPNEEKKKKGGTRIELGLDHITIHHQPSAPPQVNDMEPEDGEMNESLPTEPESKDMHESENPVAMAGDENSSDTEADNPQTPKRPKATGGKAASLGDLSRLEGGEVHRPPRLRTGPSSVPGTTEGVVLERAVSLDLGNAEEVVTGPPPTTSISSAKKRKAPAPPTPASRGNLNGSDEIDGGSRVDSGMDGDEYGKEPRLIGIGTTDTFGRRLKKSSDWGTMEEALLAGGSPSSSSTSSSTSAGRTILHLGSVPSFLPSLSTSDTIPHEFGNISAEVSTTRTTDEPTDESDLMVSMLKKINSHPEISLQSSVITSSDAEADTTATVTSTTEMPKAAEESPNSNNSIGGNRVIVTTSASVEEVIDSTTFPSQHVNRGGRGIVHLEAADTANEVVGGESEKPGPSSGESFQSSFQRAREFFEREEDNSGITPMEDDDDDEVTSSPPSLPTSPMPTMPPSSPLSLHSTTTYISSIEDIPVVQGLIDPRDFGITAHSTPGSQQHITEIQVRSVDEDGKAVESREVVISQDDDPTFPRIGEIVSSVLDRNSHGSNSGNDKFSVSPTKVPRSDGEVQSNMYINDSYTTPERSVHKVGYKLTTAMPEMSFHVSKVSNSPTDNGTIESSDHGTPTVGSSDQNNEETVTKTDVISSSEIIGDSGTPIVQIRMREGPSGWIPYRQRNSQGEHDKSDGNNETAETRNEAPKVPKKKPPVPPRKDASNNSSLSESPNRSDSTIGSPLSSNVKTVVEVPMSFTKRLVQIHETRGDDSADGMEVRHEQPMHRISEREVIQITPQELDKVMMSHSQFLSHKRGEPSSSKTEQWLPGSTSARSVVHRIVEQWVTDEDGTRKIITETSVGDGGESLMEVIESGRGSVTPPNGVVTTVSESSTMTPESLKQNMSVTRILVDPEFGTNIGRQSDGMTKTINVANLQLSSIEGKPSLPASSLHT